MVRLDMCGKVATLAAVLLTSWTARAQDTAAPPPEAPAPAKAPPAKAPTDEAPPAEPPPAKAPPAEAPPAEASPAEPPPAEAPPAAPPAAPPQAPSPPPAPTSPRPQAPLPPATPPAPGYAPPPQAWPPPSHSVHVRIEADAPGVLLERHDGPADTGRGWYPVCDAPCDRAVEAPAAAVFRFNGPDIKTSGKFPLARESYVAFDVDTGSQSGWVGGWVTVGIGGASLITGAAILATTSGAFYLFDTEENIRTRRIVGGVMVAAGLGIGLGAGLPLLLGNRTTWEIVDRRVTLRPTADGLAVSF